ncbi:MAG: PAS domain S-box protein [Nitrospirae bacterium]|nr:PAS domain S-box protein [Nitrospirota bacterium]
MQKAIEKDVKTGPLKILIVEDEASHAEAIRRAFEIAGVDADIQMASTLKEYRNIVETFPFDIALLDLNLPDGQAVDVLISPPENGPFPVVVMTSYGNEQLAVQSIKAGALDYVVKSPEAFTDMPRTVSRIIREWGQLYDLMRIEEALAYSEKKYRNLFNNAQVGMFRSRLDGSETLDMNQKFLDIIGRTREETQGKPSVILWADPKEREEMLRRLVADGRVEEFEFKMLNKRGSVRQCISSLVLYREQGILEGSIADITERKVAERLLAENEARLKTLLQAIPDLIWLKDPDGVYLDCNAMFERFFGVRKEDIIGKTDYDFVDKELADFFRYYDLKAIAAGRPSSNEEWVNFADDGHRAVLDTIKTPMFDAEGNLIGVLGIARDITERKRFEKELKESEERFRNAFEHAAIGFSIYSTAGHFLQVNQAFCNMIGYSEEELMTKTFQQITHLDDLGFNMDQINQLLSGKVPSVHFQKRYIHKLGHEIWTYLSISVVRDDKGKPLHLISLIEDLTEKRKLEDQLRQSQKMEAVGQLAGGIAHDFNNILTAIIGFCHMLKKQTWQNTEAQEYINDIHKAAGRAAELTHGLLAFSRKQLLNIRPININETIKMVENILRRVIGEDIELITALFNKDIVINADMSQLEHVLINLATNARDAMPYGGTLRINTSTEQIGDERVSEKPGSYALITVSDTGIGISKDIQSRIFDPFFTTKEVGKGTGLGLATVYGVVKQHEGFINLYSEPGSGATFKIYLPLHEGSTGEMTGESLSPQIGGNETILLVEDEPFVRKIISSILCEAGYSIIEAADGHEALDLFEIYHGKINTVILDVIMPKMGGRDVFEELKRTSPQIKVLFISGYSGEVLSRSGILDEKLNFISKPVEPEQLLTKIREILDA